MIDAVNHILKNNASVSAIVADRVYPVIAFQETIDPYIVTSVIGKDRLSKDRSCGYRWVIQVVSYESSYDAVQVLNNAVIVALEDQASGTVNGFVFGSLDQLSEQDGFSVDKKLYSKISTFGGQ